MKKIRTLIIFLALFILVPFYEIKAEDIQQEYKTGSLINLPKLDLKDNTFIIDYKYEDVTGDNVKDNIILAGSQNGGIESEDITLIIQNGSSKKYFQLLSGNYSRIGFGKIFLGDFNGDKALDMFIRFVGLDNKPYPLYSLISFKNDKPKYLFGGENSSPGLSFNIDFVDEYKISVFNRDLNKFYSIDASTKKDTYSNLGIYDDKGELLKAQPGISQAACELRPVDIDKDGSYELIGIQSLSGISEKDVVGYAKSLWKFNDNKLKLLSLEIIPYAKPGSSENMESIVPVSGLIYRFLKPEHH
ncbi:hypothetical protein NBE98_04730 [Clostridium swellfunianum]|uniref:hypothetical protein n=1 Tax=Clostridium swellfunianum TaxID=1367462 RepID=UPI00202F792D|nr:hypothetical protein [Clostridium swellfunianum]MCM0647680.1 hypothetical protein [Clostridium swellfunianum]